jgi:polar amino acid transport system substrate-binding protein
MGPTGARSSIRRRGRILGLVVLLAMLATACQSGSVATPGASGAAPAAGGSVLNRIKADKAVRVGFANEAPFGFASADGKLTGEAPEILRSYFQSIDVTNVEGVLTEFGSLIPGLQASRFDVIGAGMFIRPARCEQISFADPEYQIGEAFAVKKGNPKNLKSYKDVASNKDAKFGGVSGSAEVEYADAAGIPKDRQVSFPDGPTAFAGLQAGRVDVVSLTTLSIRDLLTKTNDAGLEYQILSEQPLTKDGKTAVGYGAMGFRKADTDLRQGYNTWLAGAKTSGAILQILGPFGFAAEDIAPATLKAEELCKG